MDLSQFGINATNSQGSSPFTIPGLDNLQQMIGTITIVSTIIGVIFIVLYVINLIQRIRADRAMIAMHKDIAAIKALLEQQTGRAQAAPAPKRTETLIRDESVSA